MFTAKLRADYNKSLDEELEQRKTESFTTYEIVNHIIRWPKKLFDGWHLKEEGYIRKAKQRRQLIFYGILSWTIAGIIINFFVDQEQSK